MEKIDVFTRFACQLPVTYNIDVNSPSNRQTLEKNKPCNLHVSSQKLISDSIPLPCPSMSDLSRSISRNQMISSSKFSQLATITPDGLPSCRTVRIRTIFQKHALTIATDIRTSKIKDIENKNKAIKKSAEVCWYFPLTREQYRIRGKVVMAGPSCNQDNLQNERMKIWKQLSDATRLIYSNVSPGTPKKGRQHLGDLDRYMPQNVNSQQPTSNFGIIFLFPYRVDHLILPPIDPSRPRPNNVGKRVIHKPLHKKKESLLRPERGQKRRLYVWKETEQEWGVIELNP